MIELEPTALKKIIKQILETEPGEIGCERCFEQLDQFVDLTLAGKNAAEALPLVQKHLEHCRDCREEFEVLLSALHTLV